jgi:two-component system chemotaxis sensor kinase CheA
MSGEAPAEFVSEAQEVIEDFSGRLLEIEAQLRDGTDEVDPDLVNGAFRAVHTLKGLASLSGENGIVKLSHALESTLDALRLGRRTLDQKLLDVLFECVETFGRLLARLTDASAPAVDVAGLIQRVESSASEPAQEVAPDAWLDESLLGVLTEYEEHRLRENIRLGRKIFRVHASFDLMAIDVGIESLKGKMKAYGEVITYLPSADSASDDRIEMDILLGSKASLAEVAAGVGESVTVHELGPVKGNGRGSRSTDGSSASGASGSRPSDSDAAPLAPAPGRAAPEGAGARGGEGTGRVAPVQATDATPTASGRASEPRAADSDGLDVADAEAGDLSLRSLSQTVRVDLRRLDHLMNLVGELGLVHANLRTVLDEAPDALDLRMGPAAEFMRALRDQVRLMNRRLAMLQDGILDVRMVPLGQIFDKLARVVRKLGREAGKDVRLSISGADTELDKLIVEELSDPLMHMIRNAIDHGIESRDERVATGKSPIGHVELRASQRGNRVIIDVADDGRGMDWRSIRDIAVQRGFLSAQEGRDISARQAINLIFLPGFSTRAKASELSGRGVGMDVVKTNIARLSGMIDVYSEPGRGSTLSITLPVTLAIIQALVVECAKQVFCIPLNSVLESIMVQRSDISTIEGHEVVTLRGRTLPLVSLSRIFELDDGRGARSDRLYVVVVGLAQHRVGLVVDELLGQEDVVIKPLGKALRQVPGIAGATELGANRTVLLLDVATLVGEAIGSEDNQGARREH